MATKHQSQRSKVFFNLITKLGTEFLTLQDMEKLREVLHMKEEFSSPINFFYHLQSAGIFAEDNVDEFIEALLTTNLMKAAHEVQKYVESTKLESLVDFSRIKLTDDESTGCVEHGQPLELFCNPCNKQICFECAFHQHRGKHHDVLSENEIEREIERSKDETKSQVSFLEGKIEATVQVMSKLQNSDEEKHHHFILEMFDHWLTLAENHKIYVENLMSLHAERQNEKLHSFKNNVKKFKIGLQNIKDGIKQAECTVAHKPSKIRQLNLWKDEIVKMRKEMEAEMGDLEENGHAIPSVLPLLSHGKIVEFHAGSVVGAVSVSEQAALVVRDERRHGRGVTLSCVSSKDQGVFWVREVDYFNHKYPIVMAGSLFATGSVHSKILIASGSLLMIISISREDFICSIEDIVEKTLNFQEGSYATTMTTITSRDRDTGVLISSNESTTITRLNRELEPFDKLDCSAYVHSISSIACVDNEILVIDSSRYEAAILSECGNINLSGKLHVPTSCQVEMRPKLVQWDGSFWGVIWESVSSQSINEPLWQHAIYLRNGDEYASSTKGQCQPSTEVVSLSFIKGQSLICFNNGKVQTFATNINL